MQLFGEMRRRNIFKVSLAYIIFAWLTVKIVGLIVPLLGLPAWIPQYLVLGLILLFPIAALLSWAYELTPEGFKPTSEVDKRESITANTGHRLNRIVAWLVGAAILYAAIDYYFLEEELPVLVADTSYRRSIAIMPFSDVSETQFNTGNIADGIHSDLRARLSVVNDIRSLAPTTTGRIADPGLSAIDIGESLSVGAVVRGSVSHSADEWQLDVTLFDARDGEAFWSDSYTSADDATSLIEMQIDVAAAIADAIDADIDNTEEQRIERVGTESFDALDAFFAGRELTNQGSLQSARTAVGHFERAVIADPGFADAWAGLAAAWFLQGELNAATDPAELRQQRRRCGNPRDQPGSCRDGFTGGCRLAPADSLLRLARSRGLLQEGAAGGCRQYQRPHLVFEAVVLAGQSRRCRGCGKPGGGSRSIVAIAANQPGRRAA